MFSVIIKGHRNGRHPSLVKLTIIFYKRGFNRVSKVISITGEYKFWNQKKQCFVSSSSVYKAKNKMLEKTRYKYLELAEKWEASDKPWTPIELSHYFDNGKQSQYISVGVMIDRVIEMHEKDERCKNGKIFNGASTGGVYKYLKRSLESFVLNKYKRDFSKYKFTDINEKFLKDYILHEQQKGYAKGNLGGVDKKLKYLHAIYVIAERERIHGAKLSVFIPFKRKMKRLYSTTKAIPAESMNQIEKFDTTLLDKRENLYLDLFLFSFYAGGMNGIDVCFMEHGWIKKDVIIYERIKQDNIIKVPLSNEARRLIEKYREKSHMDYVFPIFKKEGLTQKQMYKIQQRIGIKVNETLKKICQHLNIEDRVTWGTARSNFICKMIDLGYHPMQVAHMAGNSPNAIYRYYYKLREPTD